MIFLASWYETERIHSFFFWGRHYFLVYFADFIDVKFGLSRLTRGDEARGLLDEKYFPSPNWSLGTGHKRNKKSPRIFLKLSFPPQ